MAIATTPCESVLGRRDLFVSICKFLSPIDLNRCSTVRKLWLNYILSNPELCWTSKVGLMEDSQVHLKLTSVHLCNAALVNLVVVHLLRRDPNSVTRTLDMIQDPLMKAKALIDGAQQMDALMRKSTQENKAEVLLPILENAKTCLEKVSRFIAKEKDQQLVRVVRMETAYDNILARDTCDLLHESGEVRGFSLTTNYTEKDSALCERINILVKTDLLEAESLLESVQLPRYRIMALCEIAQYRKEALEDAKALVPELDNSPHLRDEALLEIVRAEALYDPYEAEITAQQLQNDKVITAYKHIARTSFKIKPELTKAWGRQINRENLQTLVLCEMATLERDFLRAFGFAKDIVWDEEKAEACIEIARQDPNFLNQALEVIKQVEDELTRVNLLLKMAKIDPQHDFTIVKQAIKNGKNINKDDLLETVAEAEAEYNLESARSTVGLINGSYPSQKAITCFKIAEKDLTHNLTETWIQICQIPQLSDRISVILNVAKALLRRFQPIDPKFSE